MNEKFQPYQTPNGQELYAPTQVAADQQQKWDQRADYQELQGQNAVIGGPEAYGAGSIRVADTPEEYSEKDEKSFDDMLRPDNIIDLKQDIDNTNTKAGAEAENPVDKRLDKDGEKAKAAQARYDDIKKNLIDKYTQVGVKDGEEPREIPASVRRDIERMVELSYDELEKRIQRAQEVNQEPQPIDQPGNGGGNGNGNDNGGSGTGEVPGQPLDPNQPNVPSEPGTPDQPPADNGNGGNGGEGNGNGNNGHEDATNPLVGSPELLQANMLLDQARERLAEIRAGRESRTFHFKKYGKKALQQAEAEYEAARTVAGALAFSELLTERLEAGEPMSAEEAITRVNWGAVLEAETLTRRQQALEVQGAEGKLLRPFYEKWAQWSQNPILVDGKINWQGVRDAGKKGAALALVGAPVGVAAAILAPAVAGAGIGAAGAVGVGLGARITRGLGRAKISKEADASTIAQQKADTRSNEIYAKLSQANSEGRVYGAQNLIDEQYNPDTADVVGQNRKRAAKAAAVAAAAGGAGVALAGLIPDDLVPDDINPFDKDVPKRGTGVLDKPKVDEVPSGPKNVTEISPLYKLSPEELAAFERMVQRGYDLQEANGLTNASGNVNPSLSAAEQQALLQQANEQLLAEMAAASAV